jgi:hypothetical protein
MDDPATLAETAPSDQLSTNLDTLESSVFANKFDMYHREDTPDEVWLDYASNAARYRHSSWHINRKRVFEALRRTHQPLHRLKAFAHCGSTGWLQRSIATEPIPGGVRHRYRIVTCNCHDRLCVPCANTRAFIIRQHLQPLIAGKQLLFITLTLAGKDQGLREKIDRLYKGFRALRTHPTFMDAVTGGAAFLEIKWSDKAQRWHPHLHIIADGHYIPKSDLAAAWRSITGDSYIVDIQRETRPEAVESYVCKYASKPLNSSFVNSPELLDEALMALKGRRLCLCFYSWYGTPLSIAEDETFADDLIDAEGYDNYLPLSQALESALSNDPDMWQLFVDLGQEARLRMLCTPPPT